MSSPPPLPVPPPLPRLHTPVMGFISMIFAVIALGLVIFLIISWSQQGQDLDSQKFRQATILWGITMMIILVGFSTGLLAIIKKQSRPLWSGIALTANVLLGVFAFSLAAIGGVQWIQQIRGLASESFSDDASTRPIPQPATAGTLQEDEAIWKKWHERVMLQAYDEVGEHDPAWDEAARELIRLTISSMMNETGAPSEESLAVQAGKVMQLSCTDPLVIFCAGLANPELPERFKLQEKAMQGLLQGKYPRGIIFKCLLRFSETCDELQKQDLIKEQRNTLLDVFREALADGSYQPQEMAVFVTKYTEYEAFENFFKKRGEKFIKVLEESPHVEKWVVHTFRGLHHINAAWKARGGGYSNTVTEEGWKGFHENLAKAKTELTQSHQLNPNNPVAPTAMITVSMGSGGETRQNMRSWFDKAVSAKFDHEPAYRRFRFGLWPRWHGSDEDILNIGKICRDTKRFDTWIPYFYINSLTDLASSSESSDPDEYLTDPDHYAVIRQIFEGYLSEPSQTSQKPWFHSQYAIIAWKAGEWEDALKNLKAIDFKLDPKAVEKWNDDLSLMPGEVMAVCGPASDPVMDGILSYEEYKVSNALARYQEALKLEKDEPALSYIHHRIQLLTFENQLEHGDWVSFMPAPDFQGWQMERGKWSVQEDGSLEVTAGFKGMLIKSLARVGPSFEITGEMEMIKSSNDQWQSGILFGHPQSSHSDWLCLRFKRNSHEGAVACLSINFYKPYHTSNEEIPNQFQFHMQQWDGKTTVYMNERLIAKNIPSPKDFESPAKDSLVGLGGYYDQNEVTVRYRNLKIRRLTGPPTPIVPSPVSIPTPPAPPEP